jgi:hypothetical protein
MPERRNLIRRKLPRGQVRSTQAPLHNLQATGRGAQICHDEAKVLVRTVYGKASAQTKREIQKHDDPITTRWGDDRRSAMSEMVPLGDRRWALKSLENLYPKFKMN